MLFLLPILGVLTVLFGFGAVLGLLAGVLYWIGIAVLVVLALFLLGLPFVLIEAYRTNREVDEEVNNARKDRNRSAVLMFTALYLLVGISLNQSVRALGHEGPLAQRETVVAWMLLLVCVTFTFVAVRDYLKARKKLKVVLEAKRAQ